MTAAVLAVSLLAAGAAFGGDAATVESRTVEFQVVAYGKVIADDVFRLKSPIGGRVEALAVSENTWVKKRTPLGFLANKEVAALIDARGNTSVDILQERWQRYYDLIPIFCPSECFVLKSFVKERQRVMPGALLFEAARSFRLVGRVEQEAAAFVESGQKVTFWPVDRHAQEMEGRIVDFGQITWGDSAGLSFAVDVSFDEHLFVGMKWEGIVHTKGRRTILVVPTTALQLHDGAVYLPVRVSTGPAMDDLTEIIGGVQEGAPILLDRVRSGASGRARDALPSDRARPEKIRTQGKARQSESRKKAPRKASHAPQRPQEALEPPEEDPYSD